MLAVAVAVGLRLVATAIGIDVRVESGGTDRVVGMGAVAIGSCAAALAGVLVLKLALRQLTRGRRWWTIGALVTLAGSLLAPVQATAVSSSLVLTLLHLTTGAVVILGLRRVSA